jgi:hypothetical protein
MTARASSQSWDRTRWDRLQASALCTTLALITGAPVWVVAAIIAGGMP